MCLLLDGTKMASSNGGGLQLGNQILFTVGANQHVDGTIMYIGRLDEDPSGQEWVGVELSEPVGRHSGRRYFQCPPRHGLFLKAETALAATASFAARKASSKLATAPRTAMGAAAVLDGIPPHVESQDNAALLIIDPQVDFHDGADYPGSLAIKGATADSKRIADLILRHPMSFDHIFVSLDTHHRVHIGHGAFWQGTDGAEPSPFTNISHADVVAGKWRTADPQLQQWALDYTKSLEEGGRFVHTIWPYHCVLGSRGHCVTDALMPALDKWSKIRGRAVTWVLKGQNNRTEMYSTFKAEVPVPDDPTTLLNASADQESGAAQASGDLRPGQEPLRQLLDARLALAVAQRSHQGRGLTHRLHNGGWGLRGGGRSVRGRHEVGGSHARQICRLYARRSSLRQLQLKLCRPWQRLQRRGTAPGATAAAAAAGPTSQPCSTRSWRHCIGRPAIGPACACQHDRLQTSCDV